MITINAPAKINLDLHVLGRRKDGFHYLDSFVAFTEFSDKIQVRASDSIKLIIHGPFGNNTGPKKQNLVFKAAKALKHYMGISEGAEIVLEKNLPVAAGLGGGSSDAAATIMALMDLWRPDFELNDFLTVAADLGSDIPVCLMRQAAFISGIGENVKPAGGFPSCPILLVNPRIELSTKKVFLRMKNSYSIRSKHDNAPSSFEELISYLATGQGNDLRKPAVELVPEISKILEFFEKDPKCSFANMSGSGPTCFGLYKDSASALATAHKCSVENPSWWCVCTNLTS